MTSFVSVFLQGATSNTNIHVYKYIYIYTCINILYILHQSQTRINERHQALPFRGEVMKRVSFRGKVMKRADVCIKQLS